MGQRKGSRRTQSQRKAEPNEFGRRLRSLIAASPRFTTQQEFLDALGVSHTSFYRWATTSTRPKGRHLAKMAELLETTTDYLLTGQNPEPKIQEALERYFSEARRYAAHLLSRYDHPAAIPPEEGAVLRDLIKLHPVFSLVLVAEDGEEAEDRRAVAEQFLPLLLAPPTPAYGDLVRAGLEKRLEEDLARMIADHPELAEILDDSPGKNL